MSLTDFQKQARVMVAKSKDLNLKLSYQQSLELIASLNGYSTWVALKNNCQKQQAQDLKHLKNKKDDEFQYFRLDYFAHVKDSGSFYVLVNKNDYLNFIKDFNNNHDYKLDEHGLIIEYSIFSKQMDESDAGYIIEVEEIDKQDFPSELLEKKIKN